MEGGWTARVERVTGPGKGCETQIYPLLTSLPTNSAICSTLSSAHKSITLCTVHLAVATVNATHRCHKHAVNGRIPRLIDVSAHIYPCSEILRRLVTSLSSALHTIERRLNVIMPSLSSLCTVHGLLHRRLCSETCLLSAHSCVSKYARTRRSCTRGTRSAQYAIERSRMTRTPPARECLVSALYPGEENGSCAGRERKHPTLASTRGHLAQGAARDHVAPMPRHTSASHVGRSVDCQLIAKPTPWVCRA